jgi:hypothetical protein
MVPQFKRLRGCARPVAFETGIPETPFSVAGTAFVVGLRGALYVLTARHVVLEWPKERLAIILQSPTGERLPLRMRWELQVHNDDLDASDLLIFRTDLEGISKQTRQSNQLLDLTPPVAEWFETRDSAMFFLFGYPKTANGADYERFQIDSNQYLLHGSYVGPSPSDECFEIRVRNPLGLQTFDGMSGSPVFSLNATIGVGAQPIFCGMALRGTATSQRVHFLGSRTILAALDAAQDLGP